MLLQEICTGSLVNLETAKKYGSWSGAEIEAFLAETLIPMRLSVSTSSGSLIVPLWFEYLNGRLVSCSPEDSLLVSSLRKQAEVAFDVSTNDLPYQGVRGRGRARCETATDAVRLASLLRRYLAGTDSQLADWLLNRPGPEALIEIEISWLTSWDFSGRMGDIQPLAVRSPKVRL
jgi:nitroimidazol reductase NimA-like FMN-containing flavoprotein (pyridoxamine 5'-phosphate oxidase superfamily)